MKNDKRGTKGFVTWRPAAVERIMMEQDKSRAARRRALRGAEPQDRREGAMPNLTMPEAETQKTMLAVDYPRQDEVLQGQQHYAIRVSAPESAASVDVSLDQGEWRPCRKAAGHWWHDWMDYDAGEHEVIARVRLADGELVSSEPHEFFVRPS